MDGEKTEKICRKVAREMAGAFPLRFKRIEVVVGPSAGGIILAHVVARELSKIYKIKVPSVFTEEDGDGNQVFERSGFRKKIAGSLVLIVDDVTATGGTINKVLRAVHQAGGHTVAVVVAYNRGGVRSADILDYPLFCLWEKKEEDREPKDCPLCSEGIPINKIK